MAGAAKGEGQDLVVIPHPTCDAAFTTTMQCSANVIINGVGAVRLGDMVASHTIYIGKACVPHQTPLVTGSATVMINGLPAGRANDVYGCGCRILIGSTNVDIGG